MVRIVLLLDSLDVSAWVWEAVFQVKQVSNVQIVLVVINESPKASGKKSPFLYRLYRWMDRNLFLKQPDAFSKKNLTSIPNWAVPELRVKPIQKKYSDYLDSETLQQIQSHQPDLILRFGFRILKGEILNLTRLGVWSYHHGDPAVYRGGPPAFWEVIKKIPITGVALLQLTEKLDQGPILYQSWTQTDPLSVQRNANRIFWLSSSFPARILQLINQNEDFDKVKKFQNYGQPVPLWKNPSNWETLIHVAKLFGRNLYRKIKEQTQLPHWEIATLNLMGVNSLNELDLTKCKILHPEKVNNYWADPFPFSFQGQDYLFVEEFDQTLRKGSIACILPDGNSKIVVNESWHLSYPFILEEEGEIHLIPESAEAGKIYRYKAIEFPLKWERLDVFFPKPGYDPTLWKDESGYWLFINEKAHESSSPFDELFLYHSLSLENPVWNPHPKNPIVSDTRNSRPAGRLFFENGKLFRPAQNSEIRYGYGIQINEVKVLSVTDYQEVAISSIQPSSNDPFLGIHTFNQNKDLVFLDFYSRR
ncbi:formyltransferase family protein [Algoriphagus sp.]|uniref:glucosamine inositolphosphorylceramide transferase family protein n=1 Tax=Algoriphagus sp. TaxID=1872435 RepID=UPI00260CA1A4|nr:formyltransferase family protein [Algoriphagus sp.]